MRQRTATHDRVTRRLLEVPKYRCGQLYTSVTREVREVRGYIIILISIVHDVSKISATAKRRLIRLSRKNTSGADIPPPLTVSGSGTEPFGLQNQLIGDSRVSLLRWKMKNASVISCGGEDPPSVPK